MVTGVLTDGVLEGLGTYYDNGQLESKQTLTDSGGWQIESMPYMESYSGPVSDEEAVCDEEARTNRIFEAVDSLPGPVSDEEAEYSRTQTDRIFSEVDRLLEERRQRRSSRDSSISPAPPGLEDGN